MDARADLWALGVLLFEMLTGRRAFEGTSPASVAAAILEHEPLALATLQPLAPPLVDRLVRTCLAKDPDRRWDSAHDVAEQLRAMSAASGAEATMPTPVAARSLLRWRAVALPVILLVEEAKAVCGQIAQRLPDSTDNGGYHSQLYRIALLQGDEAGAQKQIERAKGRREEATFLGYQRLLANQSGQFT